MKQVTSVVGDPIPLQGVRNFRAIGGVRGRGGSRVAEGLVYRSGHFGTATPQDKQRLRDAGLRFIDLRSPWEAAAEDRNAPVWNGVQTPLQSQGGKDGALWSAIREGKLGELANTLTATDAEEAMTRLYAGDIAGNPTVFASFLQSVADAASPIVVHCSAGKDRTGWAIALLLTVLGVSEAEIRADYVQSSLPRNQYLIRDSAGALAPVDRHLRTVIAPLLEARPDYLEAAWHGVESIWGSRHSYLEDGLGVTATLSNKLRARLLV